ncbi:MAPEG family protein [Sphingomonas bacterium]|uniref:MAPEG family protein n=1 Tax=Sphingomonas bacterium TaxID=1895847 RepID=UPI0015752AEC|nr:MAPEG family protein [Sphingomonas bacterium]
MTLPITLTMAAAATLLNVWLAFRCAQVRIKGKVDIGDGSHPLMLARMRAHANFVEYTPFFLILLGLIEYARGPMQWLWIVAIVYLVARVAHPFGMERPAPNPFRAGGALVTWAVLIGLSGYAIALVYLSPR